MAKEKTARKKITKAEKKIIAEKNTKIISFIEIKLAYLATAVMVFLGDMYTKGMAVVLKENGMDDFNIIPGFLDFQFMTNDGMAAGKLSDSRILFILPSCIFMGLIVIYLIIDNCRNPALGVALSMLLGGGAGNMVERLGEGRSVVDFLYVIPFNFFPFTCVFNVADVFVCIGGAILLFEGIKICISDEEAAKIDEIPVIKWLSGLIDRLTKKKPSEEKETSEEEN